MCRSRPIEVAQKAAAPCDGDTAIGVYRNVLHQGQVDQDRVVGYRRARDVVTTASDRDGEVVLPGVSQCRGDVGRVEASCDECGPTIVHPVPDLADVVIAIVRWKQNRTFELSAQPLEAIAFGQRISPFAEKP
jgi:hypothetical protein